MSGTSIKINYKKIVHQSIFVIVIILVILGIRFVPWFFAQPTNYDKYDQYRDLYNAVTNYNYDNGRDKNLEKRLDEGTTEDISNQNPTRYFFNLQAKALYYQHFGFTRKAIHLLEQSISFAPDEDQLDLVEYALDLYSSYLDGTTDSGV